MRKSLVVMGLVVGLFQPIFAVPDTPILRDPFEPVGYQSVRDQSTDVLNFDLPDQSRERIQLNGVIWQPQTTPYALLTYNDSVYIVKPSDHIEMLKIVQITEESVVLKSGDKKIILELGQEKLL